MIFTGKAFRQEKLPFVVGLEGLYRILLAQLERNDEIRPQCPGELARHHGGVPAIGAGGRRRALLADELRAAAGAAVGPHTVALSPPILAKVRGVPCASIRGWRALPGAAFLRRLLGFCRLFFFLCVERLDLRHIITGAAVFALQPAGRTGEMQRSRAAGALIICYLCWHLKYLLPMPAL